MADDNAAPAANVTPAPASTPAAAAPAPAAPVSSSPGDIASFLTERRAKARAAPEPATPEKAGAAEQESPSQEEDAEAVEAQPPGETEKSDEAGEPPVEPPRTLTKAEKEAFKTLPREIQESWANRERDRDAYYNRGLQEAAARSKAAEAERQAAEQARQQYEAALPSLVQAIEHQAAGEFSDIKSWDDVDRLSKEDPVRYMQWDATQKRLAAVRGEADRVAQQQQQEQQRQWSEFVAKEDKAFLAKATEFADPQKAAKLTNDAKAVLTDLGFSDEELGESWNGRRGISLRDHRLQLLILDAVRLRDAREKLKNPQPKPVPPVQRPGTPAPAQRMPVGEDRLREITTKAAKSGAPRDIAALLTARRQNAEKKARAS